MMHCVSVFDVVVVCIVTVGNIPYEATEEQLKEIFCQAGPVVSFRYNNYLPCLLTDRDIFY